jgi:coenzyme PQQ synthesis protein D (PqqD)
MDFSGAQSPPSLTGGAAHRKLTRGQFVDSQERIGLAANLRPSPGVVARDMGGSAVLVHLESNRIFELNVTGARVWSLLEQGLHRDEICRRLQQEYEAPAEDVAATVDALLVSLESEHLIGA